jgi:hypothetical protein
LSGKKITQALKKGSWKFRPFDFESIRLDGGEMEAADCMIMVLLDCRVENHAILLRCGQNLTNNTVDKIPLLPLHDTPAS